MLVLILLAAAFTAILIMRDKKRNKIWMT